LNPGARLFKPLEIFGGVPADSFLFSKEANLGLQALLLKKPSDDKTIATIVPFAAKNGGPTPRYIVVVSAKELKKLRSRVFHELQTGNTVALGGEAVHLAHFGGSESFHVKFTA
jgi:hypothetical protein